ncbi:MAG: NAD(P)H-hydrate dehydratase [Candidatus Altiarchaeota archaeon]
MDYTALEMNAGWWGVSTEELMENAGRAVAGECSGFMRIAVFCGPGNNGGDGLVAARLLSEKGVRVVVYYVEGRKTVLNEKNLDRIPKEVEVIRIRSGEDIGELKGFDLIIDALTGTGFKGELREPMRGIIERINEEDVEKLSVDAPSAGKVEADAVVSFHEAKVPGAVVVDIGVPENARLYCGPGDVYLALPERREVSHKGDYGRLIVLGGSRDYVGAPTLVAQSAFKTGVDLVTVCVPQYVADKMPFDPNLIVKPLESTDYIMEGDVEDVLGLKYDAIVVGNGMSREKPSVRALEKLLESVEKPVVVDADAISVMKRGWVRGNMILTPHAKEFERLFGEYDEEKRVELVVKHAEETGAVIVQKGAVDVISNGRELRLNNTGNPKMTVGGTGDVLAGVIGGLLAQNKDAMTSSCAGAFITGLAGDIAFERLGVSMTATDVIEEIHEAIKHSMGFR